MNLYTVKTNDDQEFTKDLVKLYKTKKPKFGGKCCWSSEKVLIDGKEIQVFWECMRGQNYYFDFNGEWLKAPFFIGDGFLRKTNLSEINPLDKFLTHELAQGENYVKEN